MPKSSYIFSESELKIYFLDLVQFAIKRLLKKNSRERIKSHQVCLGWIQVVLSWCCGWKYHLKVSLSTVRMCKIDSQWVFDVWQRELKPVLCGNLEGWDGVGGGREGQEGGDGDICTLWLIYVNVWPKPTQYCKAIILQLKINKFIFKSILAKFNKSY